MKTTFSINVLVFILTAALPSQLSAESPEDILVFVNSSMAVEALSVAELKQIFLKEKSRWPGGDPIVCIHPKDMSIRALFRNKVLGMTGTEEDTYWQDQKIRKQLSAPVEMSNTPKAVFKINKSVSYAFRKDLPVGVVKVILVL